MLSNKRNTYRFFIALTGAFALLLVHSVWICYAYHTEHKQLMAEAEKAFNLAYQKEQTYRIPVVDIVNSGALTIQSCGSEEVVIIRNCPQSDTIVYRNISGHSIESFINRVFGDLREHIVPLNIYCLSDLFAGILHDKDIQISFVIERFNLKDGNILETTLLPDKEQPEIQPGITIVLEISNTEAVRAILKIAPGIVFARIWGILSLTSCLLITVLFCLAFLYHYRKPKHNVADYQPALLPITDRNETFLIGKYSFDPGKNELQGFGESVQLNKKENSILYSLCINHGNVVERSALLEENWGNHGAVYSRSLDTYITTLRKYLKQDPSVQIVTVKSVGYKLVY